MTINIHPNRINVASGNAGKMAGQRREQAQQQMVVPKRAQLGVIPQPESLATLIRSAVAAMRQGTFWDRGTILNIVV